jgi:SAM-dependent methyltransferase
MDLAAFNRKWSRRFTVYVDSCPQPLWAPGVQLTPELQYQLERFLPVDEYRVGLRAVLAAALPHGSWVPQSLRLPGLRSIADVWRLLPPRLQGEATVAEADLWAVACALAAPPHFGTDSGRYPEQASLVREHAAKVELALDLGCGTGQGTRELRNWLDGAVVGVTREPLEAWMAATGRLPHHDRSMGVAPADTYFVAGDLLRPVVKRPAQLIVCNGLIGGPLLRPRAWGQVWRALLAMLAPGGLLVVGDHFHAGHRQQVSAFASAAPASVAPIWSAADSQAWRRSPQL